MSLLLVPWGEPWVIQLFVTTSVIVWICLGVLIWELHGYQQHAEREIVRANLKREKEIDRLEEELAEAQLDIEELQIQHLVTDGGETHKRKPFDDGGN